MSTAKLLQDLTWGDGSNDENTRGFIEASMQQVARDWYRKAAPRANRKNDAHRLALDFLARNMNLWKSEDNHWTFHDSLASICETIFLETLPPPDVPTPSFFWVNSHNWIETGCFFPGGEHLDIFADGVWLTDKGQAYRSIQAHIEDEPLTERFLLRCANEAATATNVTFINREFRAPGLPRDHNVLRLVNAMLLFYGMVHGAYSLGGYQTP